MHVIGFNKYFYPRNYFFIQLHDNKVHDIFFVRNNIFFKSKKNVISTCGRDNKGRSLTTNDEIVFF
jgi:hypothetical protein